MNLQKSVRHEGDVGVRHWHLVSGFGNLLLLDGQCGLTTCSVLFEKMTPSWLLLSPVHVDAGVDHDRGTHTDADGFSKPCYLTDWNCPRHPPCRKGRGWINGATMSVNERSIEDPCVYICDSNHFGCESDALRVWIHVEHSRPLMLLA